MLYHLLYPLKDYFILFNLFRYITFRAAYAGVLALFIVLIIGPWCIKKLRNMALGQNIRNEVPQRHQIKAGTPTMGGILIVFAIVIATLLFSDLTNRNILLGIFVLVSFCLLGFFDDYKKVLKRQPVGLNKRTKLIFQILFAFIVGLTLYFAPMEAKYKTVTNFLFFKNIIIDFRIFYIPFIMLVIVLSSNAVNLTDGLDGLATGLLGVAAGSYAVLSYVAGHAKLAEYLNILFVPNAGEMTILCFTIMGACLGFLWFNTFPAEIFMGDTGSLPLGAIIGYCAIIAKQEFLLILIGGVFVIEGLSVLIQVIYFHLTRGKRVFRMAPLHHHYELCGWPEPKIVVRFWIIAILLALLAISTLKIR